MDENGFPRLSHVDRSLVSALFATVLYMVSTERAPIFFLKGGVLINSSVPDVRSIALGGGTIVEADGTLKSLVCLFCLFVYFCVYSFLVMFY